MVLKCPFSYGRTRKSGVWGGCRAALHAREKAFEDAKRWASPLAGQEAPGKSQMLGFFSRVPDALAASGSYQTTDEGTLSMVSRAGKPTLRQSLRLFSLRSKCRLPLHKGGMVGCARLPCAKGAVGGSRLRDRLLGTKSSGSHEVTSLFYFEASIDAIIDSSTSISTFPKTI